MFANERYGSRTPSERENRVIELVAQGLRNCDVASEIGTTEHVVKNYLRVIYDKLGLWNRVVVRIAQARVPIPGLTRAKPHPQ
jgi:DNA-binding NarL/FixJ family response regulator